MRQMTEADQRLLVSRAQNRVESAQDAEDTENGEEGEAGSGGQGEGDETKENEDPKVRTAKDMPLVLTIGECFVNNLLLTSVLPEHRHGAV